jgi:hypothetical protein
LRKRRSNLILHSLVVLQSRLDFASGALN